jgi:hypothetical protein
MKIVRPFNFCVVIFICMIMLLSHMNHCFVLIGIASIILNLALAFWPMSQKK